MFDGATSFNADLSGWNTSSGKKFVSNNMHTVQQYQT
jgi:surface protein